MNRQTPDRRPSPNDQSTSNNKEIDILRPASRVTATGTREFQRAYKACLSCRQKKARCVLVGAVNGKDGAHVLGPPCARCRREQRQCVFSEKRSWARKRDSTADAEVGSSGGADTHREKRKRIGSTGSDTDLLSSMIEPGDGSCRIPENYQELSGSTSGRPSQHYSPETTRSYVSARTPSHASPSGATSGGGGLGSSMMRTVVSSGNDALNLLFEAAHHHSREESNGLRRGINGESKTTHQQTTDDSTQSFHPRGTKRYDTSRHDQGTDAHSAISIGTSPAAPPPVTISSSSKETLKIWNSYRFVKLGWLTAQEALTYVDLFFKNLSPLSPILSDFYSQHNKHHLLVAHEPVLCCTILMISSRYHVLPGIGGASRSFFIHHRLWQHCQHLIMRVILGQVKASSCDTRSIGTIEALLLMSEWHPRSLHFPPESDGWESDMSFSMQQSVNEPETAYDESNPQSSNRWLEDVIEPARRSDRMSWMLLGSALSLAHELGVFEAEERGFPSIWMAIDSLQEQYKYRKQRIQRLLYVYINQLASRIGCMSLMPQTLNHTITAQLMTPSAPDHSSEWLSHMESWMELTKLTKSVNDTFLPSASFAKEQLYGGRYISLLDHFRPLLDSWSEKHLRWREVGTAFYNTLFVEYHYVRVYTHSFGMQAVVERALTEAGPDQAGEDLHPANIDPIDYEFIQEVIDGSGQILRKVIEMAETDVLRFAPVRTFLRVTSSSIFLLKALSLGVRHAKLQESLEILDRCILALRSNILDDVHLASRYAMLLEVHVSRLRRNLVAYTKPSLLGARSDNYSNASTRTSSIRTSPMANPGGRIADHSEPEMAGPAVTLASSKNGPYDSYSNDYPNDRNMVEPNFNNAPVSSIDDGGASDRLQTLFGADDWLSLPFDPSMAPFGPGGVQFSGFDGGTLDFIWNLPE